MGTTKVRTIRVDDENWEWLEGQDGSINDTLTVLRKSQQQGSKLDEILELARSSAAKIDEIHEERRSVPRSGSTLPDGLVVENSLVDNRPKNAFCKHCGNNFAGPKFSTICPSCKSQGHTNQPAECPRCTETLSL